MRIVFRLLFLCASIVLAISVLRACYGASPLSFAYLLDCLKDVDVSFSFTLRGLSLFSEHLDFSGLDFFEGVAQVFKLIGDITNIIGSLVMDAVSFITSVLNLIVRIVGLPELFPSFAD